MSLSLMAKSDGRMGIIGSEWLDRRRVRNGRLPGRAERDQSPKEPTSSRSSTGEVSLRSLI
jgi:hypothetical protein